MPLVSVTLALATLFPMSLLASDSLPAIDDGQGSGTETPARIAIAPRPQSALVALERFAAAMESVSPPRQAQGQAQEHAGSIRLLKIRVDHVIDKNGKPESIHLRTDLAVDGKDSLEATLLFERFKKRLADEDVVKKINEPSTDAFQSDLGIHVQSLSVHMDLAVDPAPLPAAPVEDAGSLIRRTAQDDACRLGPLSIKVIERSLSPAWTDRSWRVRPVRRDAIYELGQIRAFLAGLERAHDGLMVTSIDLHRTDQRNPETSSQDRWRMNAEVTARQAN